MPGVGFDTWFPKQCPTMFVVRNTTARKAVRVFGVPIQPGCIYDLMSIPEVSEADIRHSLLKGSLMMKIVTGEIRVESSNIDLIQFDDCHRDFLIRAGVTEGLNAGTGGNGPYLLKQNQDLLGVKNGANRVFTVPDKFINGTFYDNEFRIIVKHNGRVLVENTDYIISESGGAGTGYDTVTFISFTPITKSQLLVDYAVSNA